MYVVTLLQHLGTITLINIVAIVAKEIKFWRYTNKL